MKHLFILNPRCFWHEWKEESVIARIQHFFRTAGPDDCSIEVSAFPRDAAGIVRRYALGRSPDTTLRVYAVGGDGMIFDCLQGLTGIPNVELGIIPYGRTNNFIRGCGKGGKALFRDIALQYRTSAVPVDIIRFGFNYGINHALIGIEAAALQKTYRMHESMERGGNITRFLERQFYESTYRLGAAAACASGKKLLQQYYEVELDGEKLSGRYMGIHIANGAWFAGNSCPVPGADPMDGELDFVFGRASRRLDAIGVIGGFMRGDWDRYPELFFHRRGRKITIHSDNPVFISLDNVLFFERDLTLEVMPLAVNFVDVTKAGSSGGGPDSND